MAPSLPPELSVMIFEYLFAEDMTIPLGAFCNLETGRIDLVRTNTMHLTTSWPTLRSLTSLAIADKSVHQEATSIFWNNATFIIDILPGAMLSHPNNYEPYKSTQNFFKHINKLRKLTVSLLLKDADDSSFLAGHIAAMQPLPQNHSILYCQQKYTIHLPIKEDDMSFIGATQELEDGTELRSGDLDDNEFWVSEFVICVTDNYLDAKKPMDILAFGVLLLRLSAIDSHACSSEPGVDVRYLRQKWSEMSSYEAGCAVVERVWVLFTDEPKVYDGSINLEAGTLEDDRRRRLQESR